MLFPLFFNILLCLFPCFFFYFFNISFCALSFIFSIFHSVLFLLFFNILFRLFYGLSFVFIIYSFCFHALSFIFPDFCFLIIIEFPVIFKDLFEIPAEKVQIRLLFTQDFAGSAPGAFTAKSVGLSFFVGICRLLLLVYCHLLTYTDKHKPTTYIYSAHFN